MPQSPYRPVTIAVLEFWEKPLGFLQFDWAAIELAAAGSAAVYFMTMYGEVYFHVDLPTVAKAHALLDSCDFSLVVLTPDRQTYRHPQQLDGRFHLAETENPTRVFWPRD